jgi:hypothetical protein
MPVHNLKNDRDSIGIEDLTNTEINPATEDTLLDIKTAIEAGSEATDFAVYGMTEDDDYEYIGKQSADGKWYIIRISKTTSIFTYAVGSSDMATAWTNFATQTYGDWDTYNQATATVAQATNVTIPDGVEILGKTSDTTTQVPRIDIATHSLQTIEYEHHEIHAGSHYFICDYDSSIANNETIEFVLTTPDTTSWTHMSLDFSSILGVSLEVYEGASAIVGGTSVTAINNNRNSANTSGMTILKDPTSITDGTRIAGFLAGANRTGGFQQRDREIILKQNTTYLFRFTSLANSNAISFCGEWYEHTNKIA